MAGSGPKENIDSGSGAATSTLLYFFCASRLESCDSFLLLLKGVSVTAAFGVVFCSLISMVSTRITFGTFISFEGESSFWLTLTFLGVSFLKSGDTLSLRLRLLFLGDSSTSVDTLTGLEADSFLLSAQAKVTSSLEYSEKGQGH